MSDTKSAPKQAAYQWLPHLGQDNCSYFVEPQEDKCLHGMQLCTHA
jgi:hypothetical protein